MGILDKKMKSERAEISVAMIVTIILLVVGFIILLIFYYNIGGTGTIDQQICHESVIFRATLPSLTQDYIPLKCKTQKYCITNRLIGNNCSSFTGEKGITKVRVTSTNDIEKLYAQEILKCWQMMGEGKVSLFSQGVAKTFGIGSVYPSCAICSRIAIDVDSINKSKIDLSDVNVYEYMLTHKVPSKEISYYEAIATENPSTLSLSNTISLNPITKTTVNGKDSIIAGNQQNVSLSAISNDSKEIYSNKENAILFMQISAPEQGGSILNIGKVLIGTAAATHVLAPTVSWQADKAVAKVCTSGGWVGPVLCLGAAAIAVAFQQGNVAHQRSVTAGYCGDISTGTDARNGCSVVRPIEYNITDVSKYCSVIETIP